MRTIFVFVRQAIAVVFITVILLEISLRVFHHFRPQAMFYSSSYDRFRGTPHTPVYGFNLNSHGFMDVEFKVEKDPGTFRIIGIGDSFAFGVVPYPHNYLTLLEQGLNGNGGAFELINMGISGTNPPDYLALLVNEGLRLKPEMVLLSFFIGNDFQIPGRRVLDYSYVATALKYVYSVKTKLAGRDYPARTEYDDERIGPFTDDAYLELETARSAVFRKQNERFGVSFERAVTHLREIQRICALQGIRLTVALLPDELQVDLDLQRRVVKASGLSADAFDFALPNSLLKRRLDELKIDHIDLLPEFRDAAAGARLYVRNDTHWNIKGNELASRLILVHLQAQLAQGAN